MNFHLGHPDGAESSLATDFAPWHLIRQLGADLARSRSAGMCQGRSQASATPSGSQRLSAWRPECHPPSANGAVSIATSGSK